MAWENHDDVFLKLTKTVSSPNGCGEIFLQSNLDTATVSGVLRGTAPNSFFSPGLFFSIGKKYSAHPEEYEKHKYNIWLAGMRMCFSKIRKSAELF